MWDTGNGWWTFHSAVTWVDVVIAKFEEFRNKRRKKE